MKTGTMVMVGVGVLAVAGGVGYYLWSKGKAVTDDFGAYGPASVPAPSTSPFRGRALPSYSTSVPTGLMATNS
jgi:hypothetical protein